MWPCVCRRSRPRPCIVTGLGPDPKPSRSRACRTPRFWLAGEGQFRDPKPLGTGVRRLVPACPEAIASKRGVSVAGRPIDYSTSVIRYTLVMSTTISGDVWARGRDRAEQSLRDGYRARK
jgi:hypothetical protein